jgi:anti-anti-sigma factor
MAPETSAAAPTTSESVSGHSNGSVLSWTTESLSGVDLVGGQIVVLRVFGEIDLLSYPLLHTALDAALFGAVDQPTSHLVVDLAGVTFCSARGFTLLADTARAAAACTVDYALSGGDVHLERYRRILDAVDITDQHPTERRRAVPRYVSAASAVIAIRATGSSPAARHGTRDPRV